MAYDVHLADRIRAALEGEPSVIEKKMFGGLHFMVRGKLTAGAGSSGMMLLKCDPARADELTSRDEAAIADMGGRSMGNSWISVDAAELPDDQLGWWIDVALDYNAQTTDT